MDFGIHVTNRGPGIDRESIITLAQCADQFGYHSLWVSDHVVVPAQLSSVYPYGGGFTVAGTENYFEPLITLACIAGCTRQARLGTSVLVLPYRPPVLAAKMIATLDALSAGRVILGVGAGWLEEEFLALQAPPFARRGDVTDEQLRIFQALWTQPEPAFDGQFYRFPALRFAPKPLQRPHPPIWVGGHGKRAMRRAVQFGDGWQAVRLSPEELAEHLSRLRPLLEAAGRPSAQFTISYRCSLHVQDAPEPGRATWELFAPPSHIAASLRRLADLGVQHVVFDLRADVSQQERLRTIERFAREVMPGFHA